MASKYNRGVSGGLRQAGNRVALSRALVPIGTLQQGATHSSRWPAPSSEDTELGVLMGPEVGHGETKVYAGVQA